jgi:4-hydroxy-2-oxoheptanedioate aldolase
MKHNKTKEKLISNQLVFGSFVFFPEPGHIEILGHAGYDFVVIDLEHAALDMRDVQTLALAADSVGITPVVRIGEKSLYAVSRVLDAGAQGIMVPHIMNPTDAQEIIDFTRYPPTGSRPTCTGVRATQYTASVFSNHLRQSNQEMLVIGLIEDASAVDLIEEIAGVPGLDVIMPGPGDLSVTLNVPGNFEHPLVIESVSKVINSVDQAANKFAGMYVSSVEQAKRWLGKGVKLIVYSMDTRVIFNAYEEALRRMREFLDAGTT